jgi:hypothetical protein
MQTSPPQTRCSPRTTRVASTDPCRVSTALWVRPSGGLAAGVRAPFASKACAPLRRRLFKSGVRETTEGHAADGRQMARTFFSRAACRDWRINRDWARPVTPRPALSYVMSRDSRTVSTFNEHVTHSNTGTTWETAIFTANRHHCVNVRRYLNIPTRRQRQKWRVRSPYCC